MEDEPVPASGGLCGPKCKTRYLMAILGSIGMGIIYGLKVNLHVAIVTMVNNTAIAAAAHLDDHLTVTDSAHLAPPPVAIEGCVAAPVNATTRMTDDGPFDWGTEVQGYLLSSYFWGYLVAQLPGGRIAETLSAKWLMFFAVALNIVCVLLAPVMSTLHYGALLALRVLQGIGGGVTFPAMHVLLAHWAPPNERSVMSNLVYAGTALGTVIFMFASGVIAGGLSWEWVFYIEGGVSCVWLLLWAGLISDTPQQQKMISQSEREYIENALRAESGGGAKAEHPPMPWKAALTSPAFLAILVAHTCSNWGWYMVLIELPLYMKNVLMFPISENAVLTALPFLTMYVFSLILSKTLDTLRERKKISTEFARKFATVTASLVPAICFIILCYIGCQRALAVVLMTLAVTAIGGMFSGFLSNHIDIAPNHAGTLVAITNTVATIPGIVVPVVVGKLTHSDPSIASWRIIFWVTVALYIVEIVVYVTFGKGDVQRWNQLPSDHEPTEAQPLKSPQEKLKE